MFGASIQYNLDPFSEFSAKKCRNALKLAQLSHYPLEFLSRGRRHNLSVGERQLLCRRAFY